jgi:hypothetical protein
VILYALINFTLDTLNVLNFKFLSRTDGDQLPCHGCCICPPWNHNGHVVVDGYLVFIRVGFHNNTELESGHDNEYIAYNVSWK